MSAEQLDGGPIRRTKLNYLTLTMLLQATITKISQHQTAHQREAASTIIFDMVYLNMWTNLAV